jgi:hypothetical protein
MERTNDQRLPVLLPDRKLRRGPIRRHAAQAEKYVRLERVYGLSSTDLREVDKGDQGEWKPDDKITSFWVSEVSRLFVFCRSGPSADI